ncbi:MAG: regulatory iron-sulfur-containing complex subunit RicT [Paludibacteraceae bacterium]
MANLSGGGCNLNEKGCSKRTDKKLDTFDWLCDIPESQASTDLVEVIFKNTRKGYFRNTNDLKLEKGDVVAVESTPGHDIGTVSLTGHLVLLQMKKNHVDPARVEIKRVYRKARPVDLEKYEEAKSREHETMLRARKIAEDLKLNMKIGDVEFQGDGNKAIFYYIADERVDFRQLIKVLADAFKVRIEMKQIGARQEAGRIGGIGPCGRPLCCSSWMSSFVSVATSAARYQELSLNPQKLAGQCAKLKCCMNFEVDAYVEAQKGIPSKEIQLETMDGTFYHFKTDVFGGIMQYSSSPTVAANIVSVPVSRVKEIIALNKQGIKVDSLLEASEEEEKATDYENVVGQDSLTRFDKRKKNNKRPMRKPNPKSESEDGATPAETPSAENAEQNADSQQQNQNRQRDNRNAQNRDGQRRPQNNRNNRDGRPQRRNDQPMPQRRNAAEAPKQDADAQQQNAPQEQSMAQAEAGQARNGNGQQQGNQRNGGRYNNNRRRPRPDNNRPDNRQNRNAEGRNDESREGRGNRGGDSRNPNANESSNSNGNEDNK